MKKNKRSAPIMKGRPFAFCSLLTSAAQHSQTGLLGALDADQPCHSLNEMAQPPPGTEAVCKYSTGVSLFSTTGFADLLNL
jgi:hypothetical protein